MAQRKDDMAWSTGMSICISSGHSDLTSRHIVAKSKTPYIVLGGVLIVHRGRKIAIAACIVLYDALLAGGDVRCSGVIAGHLAGNDDAVIVIRGCNVGDVVESGCWACSEAGGEWWRVVVQAYRPPSNRRLRISRELSSATISGRTGFL